MTQSYATRANVFGLSGKKIVVDLTPMLPGGENGGAKLMTVELVHALIRLLPQTSFVLLTAQISDGELEWLEKQYPNIKRVCVLHNRPPASSTTNPSAAYSWQKRIFQRLPEELKYPIKALHSRFSAWKSRTVEKIELRLKQVLPEKVKKMVRRLREGGELTTGSQSLVGQLGASLLFCPFTAPFYADPLIPTVSVIYDLQYRAYPQFFTPEERLEREHNFRIAYRTANHLVAISEFVRKTVLDVAKLSPERVTAIPIGLLRTPEQVEDEPVKSKLLERYSLSAGQYILYPANFWKHKNHAMLLTAFNIYKENTPGSSLKLVCTGSPGPGAEAFREAACRMGLEDSVIYPGYVTSGEFDLLLRSGFAMVFPSLYEGFGIPVLEAMSAGVPVLCSDVTSLPEVGGDAVLYFNPSKPHEIVDALTRLAENPDLRESLVRRGLQRAPIFEGAERMALQYMDVFMKALRSQTNGASTPADSSAHGE